MQHLDYNTGLLKYLAIDVNENTVVLILSVFCKIN